VALAAVVLGLAASAAQAGTVVRLAGPPSPSLEKVLRTHALRLGAPVFRGHPEWRVHALRGRTSPSALAALRAHPRVSWVETQKAVPRSLRSRDQFPAKLHEPTLSALAAPVPQVAVPDAPTRATRAAAVPVAPPTDCLDPIDNTRAGLAQGQPNDPLYCAEDTQPQAYYAEEWNNFCFLPKSQAASVLAGAPNTPRASGICADAAWANGAFGQGTVIAILDSGVKYDHPELAPRMVNATNNPAMDDPAFPGANKDGNKVGWNFYDDNAEPMDFDGHGTGRAGIAVAEADNGSQMAGVAPKARLMAVKVGDTYVVHSQAAAQGIVYAADHGADVINTSLGVTGNSRLLRMAAVYAHERGVFFAAATANEYSNHHNYPTNLDTVAGATGLGPNLGVGQEQRCDAGPDPLPDPPPPVAGTCTPAQPQTTFMQKVNYANYGAIADFSTPVDTPSTNRFNGSGIHASGTSTAAPHLAGAAAIVRSAGYLAGFCAGKFEIDDAFPVACPERFLSADELRQILALTATRVHNEDAAAGTHNSPPNPSGDPTAAGGEYYPLLSEATADGKVLAWNQWTGFGRPNLYAATLFAKNGLVPPEVQMYGDTPPASVGTVKGPLWFGLLDPAKTPAVPIVGHVRSRALPAGQTLRWDVQVAPCLEPKESDFATIGSGTGPKDGVLTTWTLPTTLGTCSGGGGMSRPFSPAGTYTIRTLAYARTAAGQRVVVDNPANDPADASLNDPNAYLPASLTLYGQDRRVVTIRPKAAADRAGSPHYIGSSGEGSPTLYDLEGKGELDAILATADGEIQVRRPDGSMVPGWPVSADDLSTYGPSPVNQPIAGEVARAQFVGAVAVGDLEGDGQPEVIASLLKGGVYAWHRDGTRVDGFPVLVPPPPVDRNPTGGPFSTAGPNDCTNPHEPTSANKLSDYGSLAAPVLYDINGDKRLEVIQAAGNQCVYGIGSDGAVLWSFRPKDASITGSPSPAKIAATPAVGDMDRDGKVDLVVGTEEVQGTLPQTSGRLYAYDLTTTPVPTLKAGWPKVLPSVAAAGVPAVATGVISSPALYPSTATGATAGTLQTVTGVFLSGDPNTPVRSFNGNGSDGSTIDTQQGGAGTNATDYPFHWGITQTAVGRFAAGSAGPLNIVTGGFGAGLLVDTAAAPGKKTDFEHLVGAWDAANGDPVATFPRQIEDWQFLSGPVIADVKGGGARQVVAGSGEGFIHAFDPAAAPVPASPNLSTSLSRYNDLAEPAGFPVNTGGHYITSTPAVGQLKRGEKVSVATVTRDGYLFYTTTNGDPAANDQWWRFHHDEHNTGRHGVDTRPPATVENLAAVPGAGTGMATVTWKAVGDDWWVGTPAAVELVWSPDPITDAAFGALTPVAGVVALGSGMDQSVAVSGLPVGQKVHFALRSVDDVGNKALISRTDVTLTPGVDPTSTPTSTPTETPTSTPTETPTSTPTETPTSTPTESPTSTPTETPTSTPTSTPTETPTSTPTQSPTSTATQSPTSTATESATATQTAVASATPPSGPPYPIPGPTCTDTAALAGVAARATGRGARFSFTRSGLAPVSIEVFRETSRGRLARRPRRVARFAGVNGPVIWKAENVPAGTFLVRFRTRRSDGTFESRRLSMTRSRNRFRTIRDSDIRRPCELLAAYGVARRSGFGATLPMLLSYRLSRSARVTFTLVRRGRPIVSSVFGTRGPGAVNTIRVAGTRLRRGTYLARITVVDDLGRRAEASVPIRRF